MFPINHKLSDQLSKREQEGSLRRLSSMEGMIDFCSNDYLGFSRSDEFRDMITTAMKQTDHHIGATGSRMISGNSNFIEQLERDIAAFHKAEAGLLYNSGYDANVGFFSAVPQRGDTILYDDLIHASVRDGVRLSFAQSHSFKHNDVAHCAELISKASGNVFIAVESVYSMDGDMAPMIELTELCAKHNAHLVVDEAHATGVIGNKGEGLVVHLGLQDVVFARIHTFGKALGTHGGIILGSNLLRDFLINYSRSFIYTTGLPHHSHIAIQAAYQFLQDNIEWKAVLHQNIEFFKEYISAIEGLQLIESNSPIQALMIPGNQQVKGVAEYLQEKGFGVKAILSPTVAKGAERLRISLHAHNTEEEIIELINALPEAIKQTLKQ